MTRLMAMTFWGKERFLQQPAGGEADEAHASAFDKGLAQHDAHKASAGDRPHHEPGEHVGPADQHDFHTQAAHVHIPHESPKSMWMPLVVLAVLATIGGFFGVGPAFRFITRTEHPGGRLNIVQWLDPIIWNPVTREFGKDETHAANEPGVPAPEAGEHAVATYQNVNPSLAHAVESRLHSELGTEWLFIIISIVVALIGMGLGYLFYIMQPALPDIWAARLRPLYNASYNKYWVDEFYGWAITRRTMDASRAVFTFDSRVVDGAVNGVAALSRLLSRIVGGIDKYFVDGLVISVAAFVARLMSPLLRAAQTGLTQNYALVMVLGLMIGIIAFYGADIVRAAADTAAAIKSMFGISF